MFETADCAELLPTAETNILKKRLIPMPNQVALYEAPQVDRLGYVRRKMRDTGHIDWQVAPKKFMSDFLPGM